MPSPDIDRIVDDIIARLSEREGASFSSRSYSNRPLIQTGRQMRERAERPGEGTKRPAPSLPSRQDATPPIYRQMAKMATEARRARFSYGTSSSAELFTRQARLMESWEDDYAYHGNLIAYYPTYEMLSLAQLRGYFTWRAKVRHGEMPDAPQAFAYLLAYELIAGVGTKEGEQALHDLESLEERYVQTPTGSRSGFGRYLAQWRRDYIVYHGLEERFPTLREEDEVAVAISVLRDAQAHALEELGRKPRVPHPPKKVDDESLLRALCTASTHDLRRSRLYKDRPEDTAAICGNAFRGYVAHCARRRKTDFVEGLFGEPCAWRYTMFSSAVFYEPVPHVNAVVTIGHGTVFRCKEGIWTLERNYDGEGASPDLGALLRAIDQRSRDALGHPHPLKAKARAPYEEKIINDAIRQRMDEISEAQRRAITIDLSQLERIRAASDVTREALLVDEEREGDEGASWSESTSRLPQPQAPERAETDDGGEEAPEGSAAARASGLNNLQVSLKDSQALVEVDTQGWLSQSEEGLLKALISNSYESFTPETGTFISVVVDSLNEKLFDIVGDAPIEMEGDTPVLVEDYRPEVEGALDL